MNMSVRKKSLLFKRLRHELEQYQFEKPNRAKCVFGHPMILPASPHFVSRKSSLVSRKSKKTGNINQNLPLETKLQRPELGLVTPSFFQFETQIEPCFKVHKVFWSRLLSVELIGTVFLHPFHQVFQVINLQVLDFQQFFILIEQQVVNLFIQ